MHKVFFVSYDLRDGGSPKVLSIILRHLDRNLFDPVLVTYSDARVYPIPPEITEHNLQIKGGGGLFQKVAANLTAVFRLRQLLCREQPEIAVGMGGITNWGLMLAGILAGGRTAVIIGEHGAKATKYRKDRVTAGVLTLLSRFLYPRAERIIAVSNGVQRYLVNDIKIPECKIVHIPNPVDVKRVKELSEERVDHPWLIRRDVPVVLWVGRIEPVKRLSNLIRAFERVVRRVDSRLIIVGEGSERASIHELVKQRGLQEKVDFVGFQSNPYRYMSKSSVFAFASVSEGFGMVLVEAMACGLPVVSTDCVAGPAEILENGKCGILVPVGDEDALAKGILQILTDPALRERLISAGARRVSDFEPARMVRSYEQLFHEVCSGDSDGNSLANQH